MDEDKIIEFTRNKDYTLVESLGQGACGKTVLLRDDTINEYFVCKKYTPYDEKKKEELYKRFVLEIKLLHLLYHENIVRVFNHYLYPKLYAGYIIMEYIKGMDVETYLKNNPENINEIFMQVIEGFTYLESCNILHRDIRPLNILVRNEDGIVKIIDFGFGKRNIYKEDFDKSISLNLWCEPPNEFNEHTYNFLTEIYFIGKLFEKIIKEQEIESFKYKSLLLRMCDRDINKRISKFIDIKYEILSNRFFEIEYSSEEKNIYKGFSNLLVKTVGEISNDAKYHKDIDKIQNNLEALYKRIMLEETLPSNSSLINCFIDGNYTYYKRTPFTVSTLKLFLILLRQSSKEKKNIIFSNLHSKLDVINRYNAMPEDDDIPF